MIPEFKVSSVLASFESTQPRTNSYIQEKYGAATWCSDYGRASYNSICGKANFDESLNHDENFALTPPSLSSSSSDVSMARLPPITRSSHSRLSPLTFSTDSIARIRWPLRQLKTEQLSDLKAEPRTQSLPHSQNVQLQGFSDNTNQDVYHHCCPDIDSGRLRNRCLYVDFQKDNSLKSNIQPLLSKVNAVQETCPLKDDICGCRRPERKQSPIKTGRDMARSSTFSAEVSCAQPPSMPLHTSSCYSASHYHTRNDPKQNGLTALCLSQDSENRLYCSNDMPKLFSHYFDSDRPVPVPAIDFSENLNNKRCHSEIPRRIRKLAGVHICQLDLERTCLTEVEEAMQLSLSSHSRSVNITQESKSNDVLRCTTLRPELDKYSNVGSNMESDVSMHSSISPHLTSHYPLNRNTHNEDLVVGSDSIELNSEGLCKRYRLKASRRLTSPYNSDARKRRKSNTLDCTTFQNDNSSTTQFGARSSCNNLSQFPSLCQCGSYLYCTSDSGPQSVGDLYRIYDSYQYLSLLPPIGSAAVSDRATSAIVNTPCSLRRSTLSFNHSSDNCSPLSNNHCIHHSLQNSHQHHRGSLEISSRHADLPFNPNTINISQLFTSHPPNNQTSPSSLPTLSQVPQHPCTAAHYNKHNPYFGPDSLSSYRCEHFPVSSTQSSTLERSYRRTTIPSCRCSLRTATPLSGAYFRQGSYTISPTFPNPQKNLHTRLRDDVNLLLWNRSSAKENQIKEIKKTFCQLEKCQPRATGYCKSEATFPRSRARPSSSSCNRYGRVQTRNNIESLLPASVISHRSYRTFSQHLKTRSVESFKSHSRTLDRSRRFSHGTITRRFSSTSISLLSSSSRTKKRQRLPLSDLRSPTLSTKSPTFCSHSRLFSQSASKAPRLSSVPCFRRYISKSPLFLRLNKSLSISYRKLERPRSSLSTSSPLPLVSSVSSSCKGQLFVRKVCSPLARSRLSLPRLFVFNSHKQSYGKNRQRNLSDSLLSVSVTASNQCTGSDLSYPQNNGRLVPKCAKCESFPTHIISSTSLQRNIDSDKLNLQFENNFTSIRPITYNNQYRSSNICCRPLGVTQKFSGHTCPFFLPTAKRRSFLVDADASDSRNYFSSKPTRKQGCKKAVHQLPLKTLHDNRAHQTFLDKVSETLRRPSPDSNQRLRKFSSASTSSHISSWISIGHVSDTKTGLSPKVQYNTTLAQGSSKKNHTNTSIAPVLSPFFRRDDPMLTLRKEKDKSIKTGQPFLVESFANKGQEMKGVQSLLPGEGSSSGRRLSGVCQNYPALGRSEVKNEYDCSARSSLLQSAQFTQGSMRSLSPLNVSPSTIQEHQLHLDCRRMSDVSIKGPPLNHSISTSTREYLLQLAVAMRAHLEAFCQTGSLFEFVEQLSLCCSAAFKAPLVLAFVHDIDTDELVTYFPYKSQTWQDALDVLFDNDVKNTNVQNVQHDGLAFEVIRVSGKTGFLGTQFRKLIDAEWSTFYLDGSSAISRRSPGLTPSDAPTYTQPTISRIVDSKESLSITKPPNLESSPIDQFLSHPVDESSAVGSSPQSSLNERRSRKTLPSLDPDLSSLRQIQHQVSADVFFPTRSERVDFIASDDLPTSLYVTRHLHHSQSSFTSVQTKCRSPQLHSRFSVQQPLGSRFDCQSDRMCENIEETKNHKELNDFNKNQRITQRTPSSIEQNAKASDAALASFLERKLAHLLKRIQHDSSRQSQGHSSGRTTSTNNSRCSYQSHHSYSSPSAIQPPEQSPVAAYGFGDDSSKNRRVSSVRSSFSNTEASSGFVSPTTLLLWDEDSSFSRGRTPTGSMEYEKRSSVVHANKSFQTSTLPLFSLGLVDQRGRCRRLSTVFNVLYGGLAPTLSPRTPCCASSSCHTSLATNRNENSENCRLSLAFFNAPPPPSPTTNEKASYSSHLPSHQRLSLDDTLFDSSLASHSFVMPSHLKHRYIQSGVSSTPLMYSIIPSSTTESFPSTVVYPPIDPLDRKGAASLPHRQRHLYNHPHIIERYSERVNTDDSLAPFVKRFEIPKHFETLDSDENSSCSKRFLDHRFSDFKSPIHELPEFGEIVPDRQVSIFRRRWSDGALSYCNKQRWNYLWSINNDDLNSGGGQTQDKMPIIQSFCVSPRRVRSSQFRKFNYNFHRQQSFPAINIIAAESSSEDESSVHHESETESSNTSSRVPSGSLSSQAPKTAEPDQLLNINPISLAMTIDRGFSSPNESSISMPSSVPVLCRTLFNVQGLVGKIPIGMLCIVSPTEDSPEPENHRKLLDHVAHQTQGLLRQVVQLDSMRREQAKRNILLRFHREVCKDMNDPEKTVIRLLRLVLDAMNVADVVLFIADYASRDFICCSGNRRTQGMRLSWSDSLLGPCFHSKRIRTAASASTTATPKFIRKTFPSHAFEEQNISPEAGESSSVPLTKTFHSSSQPSLAYLNSSPTTQRLNDFKIYSRKSSSWNNLNTSQEKEGHSRQDEVQEKDQSPLTVPNFNELYNAESIHISYDTVANDVITRSAMCVPLMNAEGVVMAVMKLINRYPSNESPPRSIPIAPVPTPTFQSTQKLAESSTCNPVKNTTCSELQPFDPFPKFAPPPLSIIPLMQRAAQTGPAATAAGLLSVDPSMWDKIHERSEVPEMPRERTEGIENVIMFSREDEAIMQALSEEVTHVFGGLLSRFCMRVILRSQPQPSILQAAFPSDGDPSVAAVMIRELSTLTEKQSFWKPLGRQSNAPCKTEELLRTSALKGSKPVLLRSQTESETCSLRTVKQEQRSRRRTNVCRSPSRHYSTGLSIRRFSMKKQIAYKHIEGMKLTSGGRPVKQISLLQHKDNVDGCSRTTAKIKIDPLTFGRTSTLSSNGTANHEQHSYSGPTLSSRESDKINYCTNEISIPKEKTEYETNIPKLQVSEKNQTSEDHLTSLRHRQRSFNSQQRSESNYQSDWTDEPIESERVSTISGLSFQYLDNQKKIQDNGNVTIPPREKKNLLTNQPQNGTYVELGTFGNITTGNSNKSSSNPSSSHTPRSNSPNCITPPSPRQQHIFSTPLVKQRSDHYTSQEHEKQPPGFGSCDSQLKADANEETQNPEACGLVSPTFGFITTNRNTFFAQLSATDSYGESIFSLDDDLQLPNANKLLHRPTAEFGTQLNDESVAVSPNRRSSLRKRLQSVPSIPIASADQSPRSYSQDELRCHPLISPTARIINIAKSPVEPSPLVEQLLCSRRNRRYTSSQVHESSSAIPPTSPRDNYKAEGPVSAPNTPLESQSPISTSRRQLKRRWSPNRIAKVKKNRPRPQSYESIIPLRQEIEDWGVNWWDYPLNDMTDFFIESITSFNLFDLLNLGPPARLSRFFKVVAGSYHRRNPYHNFFHGIQVYHITWMLLSKFGLSQYLTSTETFGVLIGALCHDIDHPGLNNDFFVTIQHPTALIYNDVSVLENHHCAFTFKLLESYPELDFRKEMHEQDRRLFRRTFIRGVLATDMQFHSQKLANFSNRVQRHESEPFSIACADDRTFIIEMVPHAADLSNPLTPNPYFKKWASLIVEEFNRQCDREAAMGLDVTAFMNCRSERSRVDCQIGFAEFIVLPMWRTMALLVPELKHIVDQGEENARYWHIIAEQLANNHYDAISKSNFTFNLSHFRSRHPAVVIPPIKIATREIQSASNRARDGDRNASEKARRMLALRLNK